MARLREKYNKEIRPQLQKEFGYKNVMQIPTLKKVVLNMGMGEAVANGKIIEQAVSDLERISGQKPVIRLARKAIANFKLKENQPIGVSVTLRGVRMWEFVDRLVTVALPRVRDFRGIPRKAFDGRGNYSMGITEQIIFPEIDMEKTTMKGMNITCVTSADTNDEGEALLEHLGFPFRGKTRRGTPAAEK